MTSRRDFLAGALALGAVPVWPARAQARFASYPFALGVASGYPSPTSVVLWTRLTGALAPAGVSVRWEVAADEAMKRIVRSGSARAEPAWAHSVHVEVRGLQPERWYWYRFRAGDAGSAVGRTRTAPSAGASPARLRLAFGSCQQYEQGYYGAWQHVVRDAPDLIAFLGDYIYESSWGKDHVRSHGAPEPYTLQEYRARYALYRSDADLQAAHAACPWIVTWDDHELDNDYAADRAQDAAPRERFLLRRAAAYRAFYEHMPLPPRMRPSGPDMSLYTQLGWGRLARFFVLDGRQHRSWHACPRPERRAGSNLVDAALCERLRSPGRSMLGRAQEQWLDEALGDSRAGWNILAQQTRMARLDQAPGPEQHVWTDGWDGYPAARRRLLQSLLEQEVPNPVVIGGDVHAFNVSQLKLDFDDPASPTVASEFVGTSITSAGWPQERFDRYRADNPHLVFANSRYRGYTRVEATKGRLQIDLRAMESVRQPDAPCRTLASFIVEDGRPDPLAA